MSEERRSRGAPPKTESVSAEWMPLVKACGGSVEALSRALSEELGAHVDSATPWRWVRDSVKPSTGYHKALKTLAEKHQVPLPKLTRSRVRSEDQ